MPPKRVRYYYVFKQYCVYIDDPAEHNNIIILYNLYDRTI